MQSVPQRDGTPAPVMPAASARAPLGVGLAALGVYLATLAPSLCGGDGGELAFVAARLEVAHPPGYPLFTLLGWLFSHVPAGELARRVALLSALCEAGAVALLYAAVADLTRRPAAALLAAGLYGLSPLVWQWATETEVFALHHLLMAAAITIAVRWEQGGRSAGRAGALGVVVGLGLSNHHTMIFLAAPLAVYVARTLARRDDRLRLTAWALAGLGVGLVPYVYLPWVGRTAGILSMGDTASLTGLVRHVLRSEYGTFQLASDVAGPSSGVGRRIGLYLASLSRTTLYAGVILVAVGMVSAWRGGAVPRRIGRTLVAAWVLYVTGFFALARFPLSSPLLESVLARFFTHAHLLAMVALGVGVAAILRGRGRTRRLEWAGCAAAVAIAFAVSSPPPRGEHVAELGRALVEGLPDGSILLTRGDLASNAARYAQVALGAGPAVTVLDQELLTRPWYVARAARDTGVELPGRLYHPRQAGGFDLAQLVRANAGRPVFVFPAVKEGDTSLAGRYVLVPWGLASRIMEPSAVSAAYVETLDPVRAATRPDPMQFGPDTWESVVREHLDAAFEERGRWLLEQGIARGSDAGLLSRAQALLLEARERAGVLSWQALKNLGLASAHLAESDPSARDVALDAWRAYLRAAPPGEKDRAAIEAAVAEMQRR